MMEWSSGRSGLQLVKTELCGNLRRPADGEKDITLRVYTGLPASGKSSAIISASIERKALGDSVELILSNEHKELTRGTTSGLAHLWVVAITA